ncbi:peptidyl-prolyl cis-trans isomerase [Pandoraea thiooxydans]|uniref:peptidylprolyl isomerase n=1 Tax=Pandoraea thiooxydans TaxID=445709 RepID=A0A0G3ET92_9BURK|nr:peptidylprolyl isomerase [Pandoraea thiooxydans]AKJ67881.1 peptidylprolyl isomerase [Pandoraea thiooxydans]APR95076.1 peptidyl-prolyl cis-trans isomerase [Pandoraea thiooxydans]
MALKSIRIALIAPALAALVGLPAHAQNVAVVNGTPIPVSRADAMVKEMVKQGQQNSPELQAQVREDLVNREILTQEAIRRGLQTQPDVQNQLALARQSVLIRALINDELQKSPVTDAEVQARYDELKKQYGAQEYHARHILVPTEAEAEQLIAKLKAGANFADLAKKYSKDPGSAPNGGDLDWSPANAYVEPFAAALAKLKKGEYTDKPVKTSFGYHIIELEDVRPAQIPPLSEVKTQLEQQMRQEKLQKFEMNLRDKAKIQ